MLAEPTNSRKSLPGVIDEFTIDTFPYRSIPINAWVDGPFRSEPDPSATSAGQERQNKT